MLTWWSQAGINWHFIAQCKLIENVFVESFNGRMRGGLLTGRYSSTSTQTRIAMWVADYHGERPHSSLSLSHLTPSPLHSLDRHGNPTSSPIARCFTHAARRKRPATRNRDESSAAGH